MFKQYPDRRPDIRIPMAWLEKIIDTAGEKDCWDFYSEGGNHLHVEAVLIENNRLGFDFIYNPTDD